LVQDDFLCTDVLNGGATVGGAAGTEKEFPCPDSC
jgi:hypothetical protein